MIFSREPNTDRVATLWQLGALVEQPAIYGHLAAKEDLINQCSLLQKGDDAVLIHFGNSPILLKKFS